MTRIIRVELCDECPYTAGSRSCRASQWCDEGGILRCRKFSDYPLIPDWCPLEQVAPDCYPRPPPYKVVLLLKPLKQISLSILGPHILPKPFRRLRHV